MLTRLLARRARLLDRVHAALAGRAPVATAFVSAPEPRSMGLFARGRQIIAGNFLFSGHLIEAPDRSIWDIAPPRADAVLAEMHGCGWLDDLAAVGDARARARAQDWVWDWIARHDNGSGPGWTPDLTGRRLIRWINHGILLLRGRDRAQSDAFFHSLSAQTTFLSRRWRTARRGLPRFEALTGLVYAGLSLEGMQALVASAVAALADDCETEIDRGGGIITRNPEELLEIFTLLTWASEALAETGVARPEPIGAAMERIAPVLRALRHSDGALARFHGGGRGTEGRLETALASAGVKPARMGGLHMGFARLTAGRTSVVVDAALPPMGAAGGEGHASTLAFELTSGRRPLVVNCGSGRIFGADWRRAGRATASHSTLALTGYSSSRLDDADRLVDGPREALCEVHDLGDGTRLEIAHDGYRAGHGLTHARTLDLTLDGRGMAGEDLLTTLDDDDERRFDRALDAENLQGIGFAVRFHLHPEVDAVVDLGGAAVSMALKSGEVWIFRADQAAGMTLEPSVYLESGRLRPRASKQVVLSGRAMSYATRVRWSLTKAQDTPNALRDLAAGADGDD